MRFRSVHRVLTLLLVMFLAKSTATSLSDSEQEPKIDIKQDDEEAGLVIGDHLICNAEECYPKVFEPTNEWKVIKPAQRLPPGLDIRISLEKGVKEAKLGENQESAQNELVIAETNKHSELSTKEEHEFSKEFAKIRDVIEQSNSQNWVDVESVLDELAEFAHDYKKGFKIISNEYQTLESFAFNESVPTQVRELAARIILSSLRNNPPSIDFINENYPESTTKIYNELSKLGDSADNALLVKRFLSMLDVIFSRSEKVTINDEILWRHYQAMDPVSKIKVLEIISKYYNKNNVNTVNGPDKNLMVVQKWTNELTNFLQVPELDEFHLREFFNCVCFIKESFKESIKIDTDFINWLIVEIESRREKSKDEVYKRDVDQLEFDDQLAQSRHMVFGNPNAARLKERLYDEDSNLGADEL